MEEAPLVDDQQYLPVTLNVYDSSIRLLGLGLYHTSVQVDEQEFMFLPTGEDEFSGIVTPNVQGLMLRRTILIGYTTLDRLESAIFVLLGLYHGSSYDLVTKNCNHFSNRLCRLLTGNGIPSWVNRPISLFGCFCCCIMPENELNAELAGMVPPNPNPNGGGTDVRNEEDIEEGEEEDIEEEEGDEEPEEEEEGEVEGEGEEQEQEHEQGGGEAKEEEEEEENNE